MSKKKETDVVVYDGGEFGNASWFQKMVEKAKQSIDEYKTAKTELVFAAKWEELKTRHFLGKLLVDNFERVASSDLLIKELGATIGVSERLLQYCVKFFRLYPDMDKVPEGKSISWTRLVNTYLTDSKMIDPAGCLHKNCDIMTFKVCKKCGKRELIPDADSDKS